MSTPGPQDSINAVAVIGMTGRFPKAKNLDQFWKNLCDGVEAISFFTDEELLADGANPEVLKQPNCVKANGMVDDIDLFDAEFFGFNPREAEITDPQHRLFLECAWEALEDAAYDPERFEGRIGLFSGMGASEYYAHMPLETKATTDGLSLAIGNEKDFIATRASYKINLKGPSITVQTACSTSLVAVCLACQSLLNYQSDMALAGGVSLDLRKPARLYTQGGILSPDGHCRAFDAKAKGTTWGSGVGVVVLKRLEDAIADGDHIYAVVKASAMNNDGSSKIGYTAPSVDGQAAVIAEANALAGVNPETISYIETHGTATPLGDPIEVAALTRVFRLYTDKKGFCRIGSVKTNIGHTDAAAGIAGFIKTALSLKNKKIPASLNYEKPNPQIDFENSPFFVNTKLVDWEANGTPRRAGVSSFGIGGTNAHVILEDAPVAMESGPSRPFKVLTVSARSSAALQTAAKNLADHIRQNPAVNLADLAYTLQLGRKAFEYRAAATCSNAANALEVLESMASSEGALAGESPRTVFMFPGQGSQYVNMSKGLYESEPVFRAEVDRCSILLKSELGLDLREILYPPAGQEEAASELLKETRITQPVLFVIEYALARLWMEWGLHPESMIGHSIGEYVAALLAGVFSLEDGLKLVATRGRLIQKMPAGSMLGVSLSETEMLSFLGTSLSLAAVNGPNLCTVSGPAAAIDQLEATLTARKIHSRKLQTSHAFHSNMMEPVLEEFKQFVNTISLHAPAIPYLSNVTGTWITEEAACDPEYWARHLRQAVRFGDGVCELLNNPQRTFLEVGPGKTLVTLLKQQNVELSDSQTAASLRHPSEESPDQEFLLNALGKLWTAGVNVQWPALYKGENRRRAVLPTYPFERKRYWPQRSDGQEELTGTSAVFKGKRHDISDWFYAPSWKRTPVLATSVDQPALWLFFADDRGVAESIAEKIKGAKIKDQAEVVVAVRPGKDFGQQGDHEFTIDPGNASHYVQLLQKMESVGSRRLRIVYCWTIGETGAGNVQKQIAAAFYGPLYLAQAIGARGIKEAVEITIISTAAHDVTGEEYLSTIKAMLLGPCRVIPQEYANLICKSVDISADLSSGRISEQLLRELRQPENSVVAYRGSHRWVQTFEPTRITAGPAGIPQIREGGVYLITGGSGGIGLTLAESLGTQKKARLALVGRSPMPPREQWQSEIESRGPEDQLSRKLLVFQKIEHAGGEVLLLTADVADREQMGQAIEQTRRRFGRINGVIHSAGVPAGGLIQLKTAEMAEPILAPKITGTLVLDSLLEKDELDFFILCSSVASVLGAAGQVDYTAANAFLDAFAQAQSRKGRNTISVNWDAWNEVGMAVNARELWPMLPDGTLDIEKLRKSEKYERCEHPLFDRAYLEKELATFNSDFTVTRHWVLNEHLIMNSPTLVGTAYLELARAAFQQFTGRIPTLITDVVFTSPLIVKEGEKREVQTSLRNSGSGGFEFLIRSRQPGSDHWQDHAIGKVAPLEQTDSERITIESLKRRCSRQQFGSSEYQAALAASDADRRLALDYGPRWDNVKTIQVSEKEVLISLELSEAFVNDLRHYLLHPALMDKATSLAAFQLSAGSDFLPFSYGKVKFYAPLKQRIFSYGRAKGAGESDEVLKFDISIVDVEGNRLVEIEDFTIRKLTARTIEALGAQSMGTQSEDTTHTSLVPEKLVADDLADAIRPTEGVEVFHRILATSGMTQVVVSTRDLRYRAQQAQVLEAEKSNKPQPSSKPRHPRPNLKTRYAAPENDLEQNIAEVWQVVLGIEKVGRNDNFIELGGHSLLAIQVISRLREALQMDLAMDVIFKFPTVAALANHVVAILAEQADSETLSAMLAEIEGMPAK